MNNFGLRRNNSSCGSARSYEPFMLGSSRGYSVARMPQMASINTMSSPRPMQQQYSQQPNRTSSLKDTTASVRDCFYWPTSLNRGNGNTVQAPRMQQRNPYAQRQSGDSQFCQAPPKIYFSGPDGQGKKQQNIPCQIAPLGTDPNSLIKPLEPLTVRVQAPVDLFTGDPNQPKTISISPAQLYGIGR